MLLKRIGILTVAALLLAGASPQAARIDSITPSSAARGEQVTIKGIGFGASNVKIAVGGVAAQVLAATGNSATFVVPFGVLPGLPGATTVTATNPGGRAGSIAFTVVNRAPQANAGPDQTVFVTATVQLDGAASTDADGDQLTFHWSFLSRPNGSNAVLTDASAVRPMFVADLGGRYTIQLIVNDGFADSQPDTVLIDTQNSPPTANAGPDQTVFVGTTVPLDGSGSSDVDHDLLTFRWSFLSRPSGSNATLMNATAPNPTFIVDLPGSYVVQLVVNDGTVDSRPDTVTIDTQNSRPVADAGPDQTATIGQTVQLDGSRSSDVDHDPLSFRWSFVSRPAGSTAALSDVTAVNPTFVPDLLGTYVVQLIVNDGTIDSQAVTAVVTVNPANRAPSVDAGPDQTITLPSTATLGGSATDDGLPPGSVLTIGWSKVSGPGSVTFGNASAAQTTAAFSEAGVYVLRLMASDGALASSDNVQVTVNPANQAPSVDAGPDQTITLPNTAALTGTVTDDGLPAGGTLTITWSAVSGPGTVTFSNSDAPSTTATFSTSGQYVVRLTANDSLLSSSDEVTVTVNPAGGGLPPDPGTVAPPVNRTVATNIGTSTEFLYTGPDPIQTGVAPGTINPIRAAVLRGKVMTRDGAPLSGVRITILNHPEFGQTLSRGDGMFDMAVNGGGLLTVSYEKAGFPPAQRQVDAPWQDFALLPDVALVPKDPQVTRIDLTAALPMQVAQGSVVSDGDGTRRATLLIPQGTQAQVLLPGGGTQPVTTLNLRFTEFTVGPNGPAAMPGLLPPPVAYTYAVELGADEAVTKVGGKDVLLSQPVFFYLENFLGFPVGESVPSGFYDNDRAAWVPSDSGRVVRIVSVSGGLAELDTDGDGLVDNGAALGVTDAERQQLAQLYQAGQTLWRVPLPHLSYFDFNYSGDCDSRQPQVPCEFPNLEKPPPPQPTSPACCPASACTTGASIVECQNQILGEAVRLAGTPLSLHYQSDRVLGQKTGASLDIQLSGATLQPGVQHIDLFVKIAGRGIVQTFPAQTNQRTTFTWDGKDAYGRQVQGAQPITATVCFVYPVRYVRTGRWASPSSGQAVIALRQGQEGGLCQVTKTTVTTWDARAQGLGGWSLSPHHVYDPTGQVLYLGNGQRRSTDTLSPIITTVAGGGQGGDVDGIPATQATLSAIDDIALGPDGSVYVGVINVGVRRVGPDGIINTVATFPGCCVGPIALGPDGSIYVTSTASAGGILVHRIAPDGSRTTVAGNGTAGSRGDGGLATAAELQGVTGLTVAPDGTLYIAIGRNDVRIRRVDPAGIITTVPGTDQVENLANGIAIGPDGSLYLAGGCCPINGPIGGVRRVGPDGIIRRVAGGGSPLDGLGDGLPATEAGIAFPVSVAVGADGGFYVGQAISTRIRFVGPDGIISTVAGNGTAGFSGDGGPATRAQFTGFGGIAVGPDRSLYIADRNVGRVRRVAPALPGLTVGEFLIPAEDGSEAYVFTGFGRHVRTLDALTGALRYEFTYDSANRLTAVTDPFGNVTTIERDGNGTPLAVVAPFGQRTALTLNADGYLASVTNPAAESVQASYVTAGLLSTFTDPRGNLSRYNYDALGRLTQAQDAAGGSKTLTRSSITNGHVVTLTTALGRTTTYQVERLPTGDQRRLNTFPDGTQTELVIRQDGTRTTRFADGTVRTLVQGPDPRFGMQAPIASSFSVATPGGLTTTSTTQRSVTLLNPADPLSLQSLNDTVNVNGRTFTTAYSGSTRTLTGTTAQGRTRTLTLDAFGRVTQAAIAGLLPVTYSYDARGRLASVIQGTGPDTRTATFTYNAEGYLEAITDPLGRTVRFAYDAAGRVTQQTLADGRVILFTYDAKGNVTTVTPPGRPAHTFAFTPVDLESTYTPPDVGAGTNQTLYAYNADRELTRTTRPDSRLVDLAYDATGRLNALSFSRGDVGYGYDATTGHISSIAAPGGLSLAYGYDGALLGSTTWAGAIAGNVGRTYDNDFRMISQSINGGNTVGFSFDLDSLLSQVGSLTLARNVQNGLLTGTTLGNVTDTVGYNGFGEPTSYSASFSGSPLYTVQHTRDALGRLAEKTETVDGVTDVFTYTYDLTGRLSEVKKNGTTTATYTYDSNGNRLSGPGLGTPPTYDNQDRLTQYGSKSYTYTANGELLTQTAGVQTISYDYDELGNLVRAVLPTGTQIDYLIDGNNRRIGKKMNGTLVQGFLYSDRLKPIAELDGSNNVVSRFVYAAGINAPAFMIKGGVTYRILTDHLGSPRLVVDVTTGAVVQRMDYDEFGNVTIDTTPGFQPFGFAGGVYDPDTRLLRFGARDYGAETGRWTAKDPIGFAGGARNLYSYVANDPVNAVDRSGLEETYPKLVRLADGFIDVRVDRRLEMAIAQVRYFFFGSPLRFVPLRVQIGIFTPIGPGAGVAAECEIGLAKTGLPELGAPATDAAGFEMQQATVSQIEAQINEYVAQQIQALGGRVSVNLLEALDQAAFRKFGLNLDAVDEFFVKNPFRP